MEEPDCYRAASLESGLVATVEGQEPLDLADIRNSLKSLMWRAAGVRRNGPELEEASEAVAQWARYVLARQFANAEGWELQNLLVLAPLMLQPAPLRCETRGVHLRTDFPESDPAMDRHRYAFCRQAGEAAPTIAEN